MSVGWLMRYRGWGQRPRETTSPQQCAASRSTRSGSRRRDRATPTQGAPRGPSTARRGGALLGLPAESPVPPPPRPLLVTDGFDCILPPVVELSYRVLLCLTPPTPVYGDNSGSQGLGRLDGGDRLG